MRAAVILGLGCSPKQLRPFQNAEAQLKENIEWQMGMPASADAADIVLIFGGDGTIHRHLGPLVRLGLPVLVVPAGSGNDFARAIGLPRVRDSLAAWKNFCAGAPNVRTIDLGIISEISAETAMPHDASDGSILPPTSRAERAREMGHPRYFCCIAGVGLDAEVARRANRLPRWLRGNGGYALSLLPAIFRFAPLHVKIAKLGENNKEDFVNRSLRSGGSPNQYPNANWTTVSDQPTILAAIANTPTYGGGMKIAPKAKMDDGLLEVCVVGAVDPFKLFCMFPTVYGGKHLTIREVSYFHAPRVRVETEHPLDVYADGEFVCRTPVEIGIQRAALHVIAPTPAT
jgi:diacylglycerol kinase (ATP)